MSKIKISFFEIMLFFSILLGVVNLCFFANSIIMNVLIVLQCILLLVLLILNKDEKYLVYLTIFLTLSQEFSYFLESDVTSEVVMYSFKETRLFGMNLGLIFILLFVFKIFFVNRDYKILFKNKSLKTLLSFFSVMLCMGVIIGLINILLNNNNILSMYGVYRKFIAECSYPFFVFSLMISYSYVLCKYGCSNIKDCLIVVILSNLLVPFVAHLFGVTGYYGGKSLYLTFSCYLLCPFIIVFSRFESQSNRKRLYIFSFLIGVIYPMLFQSIAFGKLIIIIIASLFLFIFFSYKESNKGIIMTFGIVIIILIFGTTILEMLENNNSLFNYKFKQVQSIVNIFDPNWYNNLLPSPKVRITEMINIFLELIKNPIYLFFGKGYMGTFIDYISGIELFNLSIYSEQEFLIQAYYGAHESINIILLNSGIFGVAFLCKYAILCLKNIRNNPWLVIGLCWILVGYGYSVTRSCLGVGTLVLGIYLLNSKDVKQVTS